MSIITMEDITSTLTTYTVTTASVVTFSMGIGGGMDENTWDQTTYTTTEWIYFTPTPSSSTSLPTITTTVSTGEGQQQSPTAPANGASADEPSKATIVCTSFGGLLAFGAIVAAACML